MRKFSTNLKKFLPQRALVVTGMLALAFVPLLEHPALAKPRQFFEQTNLVTDDQDALMEEGFAPAAFTDPNLVNPWGVAYGHSGPFWVSNQGTGTSTVYKGNGEPFPVGSPLVVTIPQNSLGPAGPTGIAFNNTNDFILPTPTGGKGLFFFANLDGSISAWNPSQGTTAVRVVTPSVPSLYTGLAIGSNASGNFLYATNGITGKIDVFDKDFNPVSLSGSFTDPNIPTDFVPFNIQNLDGKFYVTYAGPEADDAELGSGFVDVFDTDGNLLQHLIEGGPLASPWGITLAPDNFGQFSNALLVGNFNDEHGNINAFNPITGDFLGTLKDRNGNLISLPDLWALTFGNGGLAGKPNELFFSAGIGEQEHGLFGKLQARNVPEPDALSLFSVSLVPMFMFLQRRKRR
ncbi:MAG: TIGR03118 family protein [Microcystaceae cyanobacterium]